MQVGDEVTFLDEAGEGTVVQISGHEIHVLKGEFTQVYDRAELIVRDQQTQVLMFSAPAKVKDLTVQPSTAAVLPSEQPAKGDLLMLDLHLHELPSLHAGATSHEKLLHQLGHARSFLVKARQNRQRRVVLIHGNGTGRLRHELEQMLRKDGGYRYYDASYQLFGQGALEVEILHR
ncbi:MAG TPA: hypothetical protein DCE58_03400 [Cryomorphaceae bacterium]|nr:hypothetical protein [Cryomorphaceae bacterium]